MFNEGRKLILRKELIRKSFENAEKCVPVYNISPFAIATISYLNKKEMEYLCNSYSTIEKEFEKYKKKINGEA